MLLEKVVAPPLDNNAYLVIDEKNMQAAVVDPALAGEDLLGLAEKHESRWFLPAPPPSVKPDLLLKEGSEIKVGDLTFRTLHTPGHTEGSACFYVASEEALFTGDTLYAGSHGRTDTFGGSPAKMVFSLRRLKDLPPTTRLYPGHGPETILGDESWLTDVMYPIL